MNRFAIALALGAALLAPVAADANVAALRCQITDSQGSPLVYLFGDNTNSTVVETAFKKNGTIVASDVGQRPTWRVNFINGRGLAVDSIAAPGWRIFAGLDGAATLTHNGRWAGSGECVSNTNDGNVSNTGDQGLQ